jgi:predicted TIM-barrel fold metal-dependent hydrolase
VLYGGARAHNRGVVDFCRHDARLLAVAFVPLAIPERAIAMVDEALALGCAAVWVPSDAPGFSPAHTALEPVWARLAEARVPVVVHIGGGRLLHKAYHDNGRPLPTDWLGGGENLRAKDFPVVHHSPERFLACLVLDGVFERHSALRCGVIEQGASWVPGMLRNLDHAGEMFRRTEPLLQALTLRPSEYVRRQVRFTPFAFEDVGWLIEQAGPELFLFSSDYPHPEGSRDPVGKFEASLDAHGIAEEARARFYHDNFADLLGDAAGAERPAGVRASVRSSSTV